jgi:protein-S-isoprenylcysteine O-methyltransferase Ste14
MLTGVYQSAIILASVVLFYVVDFWLIRRYDPLRARGSSRSWSYTVLALIIGVLLVAQPVVWPGLGVSIAGTWGLVVQGMGVGLMAGGLALHWWARSHLAQYYGEREEVQPGQTLVEDGPYAYVRHPIYTSYFLLVVGLLLVNPSLFTLLAAIYAFVDFSLAVRREEPLLAAELPGYAEYMARTPRFLPDLRSLWRRR